MFYNIFFYDNIEIWYSMVLIFVDVDIFCVYEVDIFFVFVFLEKVIININIINGDIINVRLL